MSTENTIDKLVSLCKRRGFVFQSSEIYGGIGGFWDYGPLGVEMKNNIKQAWWKAVVQERDDMVGQDAAIIMNPTVWKASGHLDTFADPMVDCKECKRRFRADELGHLAPASAHGHAAETAVHRCPECGGELSLRRIDDFNVVEYLSRCQSCGWSGTLRRLRCGGCHGNRLFEWTGEAWRCIDCGRTRGSSPPRGHPSVFITSAERID